MTGEELVKKIENDKLKVAVIYDAGADLVIKDIVIIDGIIRLIPGNKIDLVKDEKE